MNIRKLLNAVLQRLAGVHIYRVPPRGVDVASDIARTLRGYEIRTVLDVGANVGQSTTRYLQSFPNAHIYCLEPVLGTFRQLQQNFKGLERVHCVQLALGSFAGPGQMALRGRSDRHFLLKRDCRQHETDTETVNVSTLDEFCAARNILDISYLKIDTEGGDLEVLKGGERMLSEQRIDFVEVEAGMHAGNRSHVPFELLKSHLESKGYALFGIYTQIPETARDEPHLRRSNCTFVSRQMIDTGRRAAEYSHHREPVA
jgi:FkbM family methyltransferase